MITRKMPGSLPSLLLLPPPPAPISPAVPFAAYRPVITATIAALKGILTGTDLLIVLPCPSLHGQLNKPRAEIYGEAQHLLARLYSLICIVCAKLGVDVESGTPGSVDARVLLLDYDGTRLFSADHESTMESFLTGPIIDLPTLALTHRRWSMIFSVDSEEGQKLLASYTSLANRNSPPLCGHVQTIEGCFSLVQTGDSWPLKPSTTPSRAHNVIAVGGTFDHIHAGHKLLLSATALLLQPSSITSPTPRRLVVGITGDELLKNKKYAEYLGSWKQRQEDVVDFLLSILLFTNAKPEDSVQTLSFDEPAPNGKAIHTKLKASLITIECVEIQDPFGPTITDKDITALVVSGETRSGGKAVNEKRTEKGLKALEIFEIDILDAQEAKDGARKTEDFASKISSTAIRKRKAEQGYTPLL